jgi:DNA-binding transcriptional ArsR family regulator
VTKADTIIHQEKRLQIMATLCKLPSGGEIDFTQLRALVGATDGNLGAHLEALERAGYVIITKSFEGKKPKTRARASITGRRAFAEHVAFLRAIIEGEET